MDEKRRSIYCSAFFNVYLNYCLRQQFDTSGNLTNYIDSRGGLSYTYTYRDGRTETETVKSGDDVVLESACLYGGGDLSEPIGTRYSYSGYTDDYTQDKDDFGRVNSETTPLGDVEFFPIHR